MKCKIWLIQPGLFLLQTGSLHQEARPATSPTIIVNVSRDKLNSFLPYVGRIYRPLLDPSKGPLRFTSDKFTYNVSPKNKNAWEITIKPGDNTEVEQMRFDLFDNGTATLNVTSTDRDAISFSGRIEKLNG